MTENEIENLVVDSVVTVHRELGSGLLETVNEVFIEHLSAGNIETIQHLKGDRVRQEALARSQVKT